MVGENVSPRAAPIWSAHLSALGGRWGTRARSYRQGCDGVGHCADQGLFLAPCQGVPAADQTDRAPYQCPPRAALAESQSQDRGIAGRRSPGRAVPAAGRERNHGIADQSVQLRVATRENQPERTTGRKAVPAMGCKPNSIQYPLCGNCGNLVSAVCATEVREGFSHMDQIKGEWAIERTVKISRNLRVHMTAGPGEMTSEWDPAIPKSLTPNSSTATAVSALCP